MAVIKAFDTEELKELLWDENDNLKIIKDKMIDSSRWSIHYELIFQEIATGKYYRARYSRGATECQDERPFEYEGDVIHCIEVQPKEKVIITYVDV
jgi:hypothetical protein